MEQNWEISNIRKIMLLGKLNAEKALLRLLEFSEQLNIIDCIGPFF